MTLAARSRGRRVGWSNAPGVHRKTRTCALKVLEAWGYDGVSVQVVHDPVSIYQLHE
jgi:hypothetical protein